MAYQRLDFTRKRVFSLPNTALIINFARTPRETPHYARIIASLHQEFSMTDLAPLNYFLGISVTRTTNGMFLCQKNYATEVLKHENTRNCHSCRTRIDTESNLGADGTPVYDLTLYRSLAGALQYLTITRPDLSYAVQQVCLYMHDPREPYLSALKRILYADWAGCRTTHRSTPGYYVFLGNNLLSWSYKRLYTLSRFSAEAEYHGVSNAVVETFWLQTLLRVLL
ncbi:ribonuclease H-like domain-containing protein [Tanacetum coccineum]